MPDEVLVEQDNDVLIVTINRPQARNAVNLAVVRQSALAMDRLDADRSLRAWRPDHSCNTPGGDR